MRKYLVFGNLVLAVVSVLTFTACSNEENLVIQSKQVYIEPDRSPDFYLYSGGQTLGTSTRADVQVNTNYFKIQDWGGGKSDWMAQTYPVLYQYFDNAPSTTDRSEQVSTDEYNYVMNYIKTHPDEGGTTCDLTTYFIQNVGSSYDTYTLNFMNGETVHHSQSATGGNHMDYLQFGGTHINDYNASWGPRALCVDIPVTSPTYHESYANLTVENAYKFYYIQYEGKTACYLCFDYRTQKYDNGQCDFQGDGVYNDWVIKLTPADGSNAVDPSASADPDSGDGDGDNNDPVDVTNGEDHVEINFSVNDKKSEEVGDYIATKLSIHVRAVTDVEVFIPVPAEYYCEADDMNIVMSHKELAEVYGNNNMAMPYEINGNTVVFTAAFELGGIRVTTSGMNADILNYTQATYGDGVTFEIWNYFKNNITREQLKPYLDAATVTFTSTTAPTWYINAFAKLNGAKNAWDCTVSPSADYPLVKENDGSTDYNKFYKKN